MVGGVMAGDASNAPSLRQEAASEFSQGHYEKAAELYARAVALNPRDPALRDELMKALAASKRYEDTSTLRKQAGAEIRGGRFNQASDLYAGAAAQTPDDLSLLKDWMWALWSAKRYEETAKVAAQVRALEKNDGESLNIEVRALFYAGHTEEAYQLDSKSHATGDGIIPLRRAMVHLYETLRDYDKTVQLCEGLIKGQPKDASLYAAMGRARFYQGRYPEALESWQKAVKFDPANWKSKLFEAKTLYFTGHVSEAVSILKEILETQPKNWQVAGFLIDVSSVTGDARTAATVLENGLKDCSPEEEPKLLGLADFYSSLGMDDKAMATLNRAIILNPNGGEARIAKANYLFKQGKFKETVNMFQDIVHQNPSSLDSWRALANALIASSQTVRAIEVLQEARKLDPTNPYLLIYLARSIYDNGDHLESRKLLLDWMKANTDESVLPILLYHGLTPFPNDPMLASPIHVTTATFEAHIRALSEAGFSPITAQQAVEWFQRKSELPHKAILITFDDDRVDSFHYADPVLKKYGFKAVMMAPMFNIESNFPGFASWNEISTYTSSGRWEIQAHGDQAHNLIKIDKAGHMRLFLTDKRWLDEQGRLETLDEWQERIQADHESGKAKIRAHLGTTPVAFAYPEGDYGQFGIPNFLQSSPLNRRFLCLQSYSMCFTQEDNGLNVRSRDPALTDRVEPRQDWTPDYLLRLISDQNAFAMIRQQLMLWDTWEGHPRAALQWLEINRAAGVSQSALRAAEGQIRFTAGDHSQGLRLARQAFSLDPSPDNQSLLDVMTKQFRYDWAPSFSYFKDNQTRQNTSFEQSLGSLEFGGIFVRAIQGYSIYKDSSTGAVVDNNVGVELKRTLGIGHTLDLQAEGQAISVQAKNNFSLAADFSSDWSDSLLTEVRAARKPYTTARALAANVLDQYLDFKGTLGSIETGRAEAEFRYAKPSDHNQRVTFMAEGLWPFALNGSVRALGRFTADNTKFFTANYYSPQHLNMNQVGLGYLAHFWSSLEVDLSYMPGYGSETGVPNSFIQEAEFTLNWSWHKKLGLKPSVVLTRTPTYQSNFYSLSMIYQF